MPTDSLTQTTPHTPVETHNETVTDTHAGDTVDTINPAEVNGYPAQTYDYVGYSSPCPKVNRHENYNRIADNARRDSANLATGLLHQSQPHRFFDYNAFNYTTTADELNNRAIIGAQLANSLTIGACYAGPGYDFGPGGYPDPDKPYVGGDEAPKTYYKIGQDYELIPIDDDETDAGDETTAGDAPSATDNTTTETTTQTTTDTATETTPTPTYRTTVKPIDVKELSDTQLEIEIEYGGSITAGYLREAADLRRKHVRRLRTPTAGQAAESSGSSRPRITTTTPTSWMRTHGSWMSPQRTMRRLRKVTNRTRCSRRRTSTTRWANVPTVSVNRPARPPGPTQNKRPRPRVRKPKGRSG